MTGSCHSVKTPFVGNSPCETYKPTVCGGSSEDYLNAKKDWKVKLEGGSIIPIFPGDKIAPFTPSRPNSAYGSFVENLLRHIGTGLNIPYELLLKDFSKTNYSSARSALLEAWRYFNGRRNGFLLTGPRRFMNFGWKKPSIKDWLMHRTFTRTDTLTQDVNGSVRVAAGLTRSKRLRPAKSDWILDFQH